jgi:hypothetical protein
MPCVLSASTRVPISRRGTTLLEMRPLAHSGSSSVHVNCSACGEAEGSPAELPVVMRHGLRSQGLRRVRRAFFAGDFLERCYSSWSDRPTQVGRRSVRRVFRRHSRDLNSVQSQPCSFICGLGDLAILVAALQFVGSGLTRAIAIGDRRGAVG